MRDGDSEAEMAIANVEPGSVRGPCPGEGTAEPYRYGQFFARLEWAISDGWHHYPMLRTEVVMTTFILWGPVLRVSLPRRDGVRTTRTPAAPPHLARLALRRGASLRGR